MFKIHNINKSQPYRVFLELFESAINENQTAIDAIAISSLDKNNLEVESRFVNLKYIIDEDWIFFSNYNSPKSQNFKSHKQISVLMYWDKIDTQIRIKANIRKTSKKFSDEHFSNRSKKKNSLAISSDQSNIIKSYEDVIKKYKKIFENSDILERPSYWGGYAFKPYYFEFWEGHESRINRRRVFKFINDNWINYILEP